MLVGLLSLLTAALFSGAAIYINFAEQPARLELDDRSLLVQWKRSYKRGFLMQAPLAVVGCLLGRASWCLTGQIGFVVGALLMIANLPWTVFGVMPTNKILMRTELAAAGRKSRALIVKWNVLHAVRSGLGACATLAFLIALST
ncbi:MAG: DUF1772 domain-containing protein [Acidobacteriota bacterium]|nr:DUF1772 domain-containing protein [Acidobacteriota bacterium]